MSLRGQFFLSVVLALALSLSFEAVLAGWQARHSVATEMNKALEAGDHEVDNALLSLPQTGVDAYLTRLVRSFDGNRHVEVLLMDRGHMVLASHVAPPDSAPQWFIAVLHIPVFSRQDFSPRLKDRMLLVRTDARNEIGEVWAEFRDGALILLLFSLMVTGLLHLVMTRTARALGKLGIGFDTVGGGNYAARLTETGPREISHLARAFNHMAERLGRLEAANHRLGTQMLAIQEEERADLARDLHDEMGPFLFAMRVDAQGIAGEAEKAGQTAIRDRARAIGDAITHIQAHVRRILKQLQPADLSDVGLAQAIANLVTFWQRHHPDIVITLNITDAGAGFSADIDAAIYRLVQEGLTNAARHGDARHVWVTIAVTGGRICVTLDDDGGGFASNAGEGGGMGLKGMRERLAGLSGSLALTNRTGGGARLKAEIPCLHQVEAVA